MILKFDGKSSCPDGVVVSHIVWVYTVDFDKVLGSIPNSGHFFPSFLCRGRGDRIFFPILPLSFAACLQQHLTKDVR